MSARRAAVGDRLTIRCADADNRIVTATVTADEVTRLGCGCDRIGVDRPGGRPGRDRIELVPVSCHHASVGVDFDAARQAAFAEAGAEGDHRAAECVYERQLWGAS